MKSIGLLRSGMAAIVITLCADTSFAQAVFWRMRDLSPGFHFSWALDVNGEGWIVGGIESPPGVWHAVLWDPEGTLIDLGGLGNDDAGFEGINDARVATGYVTGSAITWSAADGLVELDCVASAESSCQAWSICNDGTVVGNAYVDGISRAVKWEPGATSPTELGAISGAQYTHAYAGNSAGQLCGTAGRGEPYFTAAFAWSNETGLQPLTYEPDIDRNTTARGINDLGEIAGSVDGLTGWGNAGVWRSGAGWDLIELEPAALGSYAYDINNSGWVVGEQVIAGPNIGRATVWDEFGAPTELPTPSYGSSRAYRISENNHVVGWWINASADGIAHAAIWFRTTHGDTDEDCDVDLNDLTRLLGSFGCCTGEPCFLTGADVSPNGCVDLNDLAILLGRFGNVCP
jgi:uncharacterized membrane protein